MAKLSEIVGGLLRDLAQSHAIADSHTRQVFETYRQDPVLSQFPVPRVTIRQATLRLKFVVREQTPPPKPDDDPRDFQAVWGKAVRERILPRVLEKVGKLDNRAVVDTLAGRLSRPEIDGSVSLGRLLDAENRQALEQDTVGVLLREAKSLPKSVLRYLPKDDALLRAASEVVADEMPEVQRAVKKLYEARSSALTELDVAVNAEELKAVPDSQVSEIELTVGTEELQQGGT